MRSRTKAVAIRIVRVVQALPQTQEARVIGNQLLRSGTSLAANYRAACRGRSRAEFASKIGVALEEADESLFWVEMLIELQLVPEGRLRPLQDEIEQLVRILAATRGSSRNK
jgi:four helix bundle protein